MLSKLEYEKSGKDLTNDILTSLNNIKAELQKQVTQQYTSSNDYATKQHELALTNIQLEENNQNLYQAKIDVENELVKTNENLVLIEKELSKQYLIATTNGTVNFVSCNSKTKSSNLHKQNDLLLVYRPP